MFSCRLQVPDISVTNMTPPLPQKSTSSPTDASDFEKYEEFILEEYMDMTYGNDKEAKSSGPVHPSHFSGISLEDEMLLRQHFETTSKTDISREHCGKAHGVFDRHDTQGSILKTPSTSRRNHAVDSPAVEYMKTASASTIQEIAKGPYKNYGPKNPYIPEGSGQFGTSSHADEEQKTPDVGKDNLSSVLGCGRGLPGQSAHLRPQFVDMIGKGFPEGSNSLDGVPIPIGSNTATSQQPSSLQWWDADQAHLIDLDSSSEATLDVYANTQGMQPNKHEDPAVARQNAQTLKPLTIEIHSHPLGDEVKQVSSDDSVSDTLVIDEWPEEYEQRPSEIVQSPADTSAECIQNHTDTSEPRLNDLVITGEELQQQQEWPLNNYPVQGFTNFPQAVPWNDGNQQYPLKYNWPADNIIMSPMNTALWDYHPMQDSSVAKQKRNLTDESRHLVQPAQKGNLLQQGTHNIGPHANNTDQSESSCRVVDPSLRRNPQHVSEYHSSPWENIRNPMWPQPNDMNVSARHDKNVGGRYDHHGGTYDDDLAIQMLATNFAYLNQVTNTQPPGREMTSHDAAFEALASIGIYPYRCNVPNCPGDITRHFQEFPFPRRKSTNRSLLNPNLNQISPMPSSSGSGSEWIFPEIFEVEPNQEEQRVLLRRMRNREAAKRCRKKKKHEFIALLFKRAMLLAEYHRYYHTYHQNIPKPSIVPIMQ